MSKTLFEKIIAREIHATIVYEDDLVFAIRDIDPLAPKLVLIIPQKPIPRIAEAKAEDQTLLGHLLLKAAEVAGQLGLNEGGYRLVINNGEDGGESVPHLHVHILGGHRMALAAGIRVHSLTVAKHLAVFTSYRNRRAQVCVSVLRIFRIGYPTVCSYWASTLG